MITYKFIVCGTDNKTNLGHLSVSNTPFKKFFKKKSMYVMHARMHACCKRGYLVFYFFFFFHEQRKRRERERKKREKDTKNQMRFSRFYDICGWVEK